MELTKGIEINVKASLSVDEETFKTCMSLIKIYFQSHHENLKGIVLRYSDAYSEPIITIVDNDVEMDRIMYGCLLESED